jgi:hypothetical protein
MYMERYMVIFRENIRRKINEKLYNHHLDEKGRIIKNGWQYEDYGY